MINRHPFYISCLILLIAAQPAYTQIKFNLSGQLTGAAGKRFYFSSDNYIPNTDKKKLYSVRIDSMGRFRLTGKIAHSGLYTVFIEGQEASLTFFLDTVSVAIAGRADNIADSRITGSLEQAKRVEWDHMAGTTQQSLNDTSRMYMIETRLNPPDRQTLQLYRKTMDSLTRVIQSQITTFMQANPDAWQSLELLNNHLGLLVSYEQAEAYLQPLGKKFATNPAYTRLLKDISTHKKQTTPK